MIIHISNTISLKQCDHTYFEYHISKTVRSYIFRIPLFPWTVYKSIQPPLLPVCPCTCLIFFRVGRPCDGPIPRPGILPNFYKKVSEMRNAVLQRHRDRQTERCHIYARMQHAVTEKYIHSFSSLSCDRSKASSKASSPHSAIQSFLFQMRVSSPFVKVIQ